MDRQPTDRNTFAKGLLLAVPTILIWGVTFVNTKALLVDFSAFEILFLRFLMAYAALWCLRPKRLVVAGWREEAIYAGMGLTGVTAYQFLENCALHWTNASNVCILVSISPMTTALLSQFILNNLAPMNEEINLLRNFAQGVSQRYDKAERSAREQDNHHYYKIFADGVKTLLEAL